MIARRKTHKVKVGNMHIGGGAPISVQSMTKTPTHDVDATLSQIHALQQAGCEIIRVAVPDDRAAESLGDIRHNIQIPLVADIHFNAKYAMMALQQGVDKLRLNPGNIRDKMKIANIVAAAKERSVPIRIGVNAGSLDRGIRDRFGGVCPEAIVASAEEEVRFFEELDFHDVVISLKASDVLMCVKSYELAAEKFEYPLHIGITEAGLPLSGTVKSSIGLGHLLMQGIGDTMRVSLTTDPVEEVKVGYEILSALDIRKRGVSIIACPSCGRCDIDVMPLAAKVQEILADRETPMTVAVMGCEVNGPGEARAADVGLAGGAGVGLIFAKGEIVKKVKVEDMLDAFIEVVDAEDARRKAERSEG
ncbi:MAG: 4-hydroxy-3-methylbut-2-en-1-yl diphosphate synthase [Armatimonadetes bacterium CG2_30_59_28]|nr:flavodoxin-dependent (E)-4-hydroxy-3-methylbut-2-enyl-diphosphate synthase [Armatimonadota bacterium]OIO93366.1 MAG: 4-hydroxy-3-methylbut-2-en-1-yl diphosphate synthase [Armatimonadetes bacterium CG2_30_59_28]PIU65001.1 MAG: 4-hydroxy-3-methylbut-2-en-1-yl diphosphate synthase [Armatimonadetes bacterium CG07_land_8_20_14_0_80_59_28]PIX38175.1 MAG: 4-hydroxy-3-methylbut-2-en-1-yl diphosphate synthase [Armatimonadetes bacterium CG_4_8_14_3_um_filter_58_9]PIY49171.1 MAG: 4-hydroxy-3-methylbut-